MENFDIYKDIAERTSGEIYIGVVGPVRSGKSTFIKRFMDLLVLPNMENNYAKERTKDELPQSAAGKNIMTTEPKFVPAEAVEISLGENTKCRVRMIDCVGYLIPSASGHMDGEAPRMVSTPWYDEKIPFSQAAELGTKKVINDHSTIGIVITTDGSITGIERQDYEDAEARVVAELKAINKPFVILLNSTKPYAPETEELRQALTERYELPVLAVNCAQLKADDINAIMEKILFEFPIREICMNLPKWIETLEKAHWLKKSIIQTVKEMMKQVQKLRQVKSCITALEQNEYIKKAYADNVKLGEGCACLEMHVADNLFYRVLSETTGMDIQGEYQLISTIKVLAEAKREYDKVKYALEQVKIKGYGVVTPVMDEMKLESPVLVKHGSRYGVKIKATAPSIHLIRADIETEISPIVGTEKQSQDLIDYFQHELAESPAGVWEMNVFGKSMHEMVKEGLQSKLYRLPEEAQLRLQETLQKVINEGSGTLICIIL